MARKKATDTIVEESEWKGSPTVGIWEVDEDGEKTSEWPLLQMGKKKAQAVVKHIDAIKKLAEK